MSAAEPGLAIVAGGSGVLGSQVTGRLVGAGHRVVVLDRAPCPAADRVAHLPVDLTDETEVDRVLRSVAERYGIPRVLVNCQGWSPKSPDGGPEPDESLTARSFLRVLDVNLVSCFLTMRTVVPMMVAAGGGRVINVSSTAARTGRTTASPAYAAAKAGVDALTRSFAVRYGPSGVLVCAVAPGKFANPQWPDDPSAVDRYRRDIPLGRLATPAEIAGVIVFLASRDNTYLTGHTVTVDGGRLA
jgi:NAD(P)-dependent dehydrogenase (short-subunit alcohol dehydrogenase family)